MPVTLTPAFTPKETGGSPEFPNYPSEHMPRSQTPVVSHPLAMARTGLLPSNRCRPSAFGLVAQPYPLTTIIHFSEFNDAACALAFPLLRTPPLSDRTSVRLSTRWLALDRAGFGGFRPLTRWVILTSFTRCHLDSNVPNLSRHEHRLVRRFKMKSRHIALLQAFPVSSAPRIPWAESVAKK